MFLNITREEWKFLGAIWAIVAAVVFLPFVVGYFLTPDGSIFLFKPILRNSADYASYFSKIEQAKQGIYFFKDFFTSEPQPSGVVNPFYLLIGLFAKFFNLSNAAAFHAASFLLIPVFLITAYRFVSFFFEEISKRKVGFIFLIFGSGITMWGSWAFSLTILINPPHFIASLTLLMLIFMFSMYFFENHQLRYGFLAGLCAFLLISFHPYNIYTIVFVPLAFLVTEYITDRKIHFNHILHYISVLIFCMPPLLYYMWVFNNVAIYYQTLFLQNGTYTPPPWIVLADFSLLLVLAGFGVRFILGQKDRKKRHIFLMVWMASQFFLVYLPISTQARLFQGLGVPITIFAAYGFLFLRDSFAQKIPGKTLFTFSNVALVLLMWFSISRLFFIDAYYTNMGKNADSDVYITQDSENAMIWIRQNTPAQSVILSNDRNGNNIACIAFRHVYMGHYGETAKFYEKRMHYYAFFENYSITEKKEFLATNNIGYFFWSAEEKAMAGSFNPDDASFLKKVYASGQIAVYKVDLF